MRKLTICMFFLFLFNFLGCISATSSSSKFSITKKDKKYFGEIKSALIRGDSKWFSAQIVYPVTVVLSGEKVDVFNDEQFLRHSGQILDEKTKRIILRQEEKDLFKNWRGVMVGNGVLWFSEIKEDKTKDEWVYRIIGINK